MSFRLPKCLFFNQSSDSPILGEAFYILEGHLSKRGKLNITNIFISKCDVKWKRELIFSPYSKDQSWTVLKDKKIAAQERSF